MPVAVSVPVPVLGRGLVFRIEDHTLDQTQIQCGIAYVDDVLGGRSRSLIRVRIRTEPLYDRESGARQDHEVTPYRPALDVAVVEADPLFDRGIAVQAINLRPACEA